MQRLRSEATKGQTSKSADKLLPSSPTHLPLHNNIDPLKVRKRLFKVIFSKKLQINCSLV